MEDGGRERDQPLHISLTIKAMEATSEWWVPSLSQARHSSAHTHQIGEDQRGGGFRLNALTPGGSIKSWSFISLN